MTMENVRQRVNLQEFADGIHRLETAKAAFLELADRGARFEEARVHLVNAQQVTMGAAGDTLELLEAVTGRKLER